MPNKNLFFHAQKEFIIFQHYCLWIIFFCNYQKKSSFFFFRKISVVHKHIGDFFSFFYFSLLMLLYFFLLQRYFNNFHEPFFVACLFFKLVLWISTGKFFKFLFVYFFCQVFCLTFFVNIYNDAKLSFWIRKIYRKIRR